MKYIIITLLFAAGSMLVPHTLSAQAWRSAGPYSLPANGKHMGKVNCIAFHPVNPNVLFVGTPAGGVMWSTNSGSVWQPLYDSLPPLSIGDIAFNPTDSNTVILGIGDEQQYGISNRYGPAYVTVNYGGQWTRSATIASNISYAPYRIAINPNSPLNINMATSIGLLTSVNSGLNWTQSTFFSAVRDITIRHNDYSVQVVCGKVGTGQFRIYRSVNGGSAWTDVGTAFPTNLSRATFATTAANANIIYALCSDFNGAFAGLYRSLDAGATWTQMSNSPNIFAPAVAGSGTSGGGNQSLSLVVSPTNANILYAGSKNVWKSVDGGATWTLASHFSYTNNQFVASDINRLAISNFGGVQRLYACTGGGLFMSRDAAATWENLGSNLQNTIVPKIAVHPQNDTLVLAATTQGILRSTGGVAWTQVSDSNAVSLTMRPNGGTVYMQTANGYLMRSNDSGQTFPVNMSPPEVVPGSATVPYTFNPLNERTIFAALRDTWKTSNGGTTWTKILNPLGSLVRQFVVMNRDTNTIVAVTANNRIWRSLNGGAEWRDLTNSTTPPNIERIIVNPQNNDQMIAVLSFTNVSAFLSFNGGSTWTEISTPLPVFNGDHPIIYDAFFKTDNCDESIIVTTTQGIFIRPIDISSQWSAMGMQYPLPVFSAARSGRKLYAGTGRGIMVAEMTNIGVVPDFASDKSTICPGETIQFYDRSQFGPIEWRWEFEGGRPAVTDEQNPTIQYLSSGTFNVKLVVKNSCGKDSVIRKLITVNPQLRAAIQVQRDNYCATDTIIVTDATPGTGGTRNWSVTGAAFSQRTPTSITVVPAGEGKISLGLSVINVCGSSTAAKDIFTFNPPTRRTITTKNDTLSIVDSAGLRYQWYLGVNAVPGATSYVLSPAVNGNYYVTVTNQGGCIIRSDTVLFVKNTVSVDGDDAFPQLRIYPHPASTHVTLEIPGFENATHVGIRVVSLLGELMLNEQCIVQQGRASLSLSGLSSGMYILHVDIGNRKTSSLLMKE
ncbi:MAG: PKD domain-containing protein [Candidatus Kapabacteria bacterium]|nr:PKD domain-containing protein [Candidatus Kapabacteria bacterium]